jgi:phosphoribosylformylglycinamidine synthase subunit PurL
MNDSSKEPDFFSIEDISEPESIEDVIYTLMVNPNLSTINYFNDFSDKSFLLESPDQHNTDETGIFEIDATGQCMAMTTHAFHHHLSDDPQKATEILISRAARKMICSGITPHVVSAFLYHIDFADAHGHTIASGAKKGLENAAFHFNLKVTDRKIRFDYFKGHGAALPTVIISMLGIIENTSNLTGHGFKMKGNNIFMIGKQSEDISASEYLEFYHGISSSPLPVFSIGEEVIIQNVLKKLHDLKLISSASPVGKGGLFFTLLRAAFPNNLGFDITTDAEIRRDAFLFGEAMGRIIVDVESEKEDEFVDVLSEMKVPFFMLGHVTKGEIRIDDVSMGFISKMSMTA